MSDRLKINPEGQPKIDGASVFLLALLAVYLAGCSPTGFTYQEVMPELDPDAGCAPVTTYTDGDKQIRIEGMRILPDGRVLTKHDTIQIYCQNADTAQLVSAIGELVNQNLNLDPLVVKLPTEGAYEIEVTDKDCSNSYIEVLSGGDLVGTEQGSEYCEYDIETIKVVRDATPPVVSVLQSEEHEASLVLEGNLADHSQAEVEVSATQNKLQYSPVMVLPGTDLRLALPLVPGTNEIRLQACDPLDNCAEVGWGNGRESLGYDYNPLKDIVTTPSIDRNGRLVVELLVPNVNGSLVEAGATVSVSQESYLLTQAMAPKEECETYFQPNVDPRNPKLTYVKAVCDKTKAHGTTTVHLSWEDRVGNTLSQDLEIPETMIPGITPEQRTAAFVLLLASLTSLLAIGGGVAKEYIHFAKGKRQARFEGPLWNNDLISAASELRRGRIDSGNRRVLEAGLVLSYIDEYRKGRPNPHRASFQQMTEDPNQGVDDVLAVVGDQTIYFGPQDYSTLETNFQNYPSLREAIDAVRPEERVRRIQTVLGLFEALFTGEEPKEIIKKLRTRKFIESLPDFKLAFSEIIAYLQTDPDLQDPTTLIANRNASLAVKLDKLQQTGSWFLREVERLPRSPAQLTELSSIIQKQLQIIQILVKKQEGVFHDSKSTRDYILGSKRNRLPKVSRVLIELGDYKTLEEILTHLGSSREATIARVELKIARGTI